MVRNGWNVRRVHSGESRVQPSPRKGSIEPAHSLSLSQERRAAAITTMNLSRKITLVAACALVLGALFAGIHAISAAPANPAGPAAYGYTPPLASLYPATATPLAEVGAGTTGAVVATLPATANVTNYVCGWDVSAIGGTAAIGPIVVAGLVDSSSFTYQASSTAAGITISRNYNPCVPASAVNTAITVTTTADGTATAVNVNVNGYQQ